MGITYKRRESLSPYGMLSRSCLLSYNFNMVLAKYVLRIRDYLFDLLLFDGFSGCHFGVIHLF
jgi:hypothetical protein